MLLKWPKNIVGAVGNGLQDEPTAQKSLKEPRSGDMILKNQERWGRPIDVIDVEELKALIMEANNCSWGAKDLGVSKTTVSDHLGKSKKLDKWVPHELNENQKHRRYELYVTKRLFSRWNCDLRWEVDFV